MAASAVIFDLDGTLWDSWPFFAGLVGGETKAKLAELRGGQPAATLLRRAGIGEARFRALCRRRSCELYEGARELVGELSSAGITLGVATNLPAWIVDPLLEATGLRSSFAAIATYGTTRRHKPAADPLLWVLEQLGTTASADVWYVGDTDGDRKAARAAGLTFAWASYGYGAVSGPVAVLNHPSDLLDFTR